MQPQVIVLTLSAISSLLFLSLFTYIGWEALQHVFASKSKAAIAISMLLLEGGMILWLRFLCSNFVRCRQFVDRLTGAFLVVIVVLCLLDATLLLVNAKALGNSVYSDLNAVLFACLLIIGFLLAWESINVTIKWLRGTHEPRPNVQEDAETVKPTYGKAGYH